MYRFRWCLIAIALLVPLAFGSQSPSPAASTASSGANAAVSPEAAEVLALDKKIGEAIVAGDVAFFNSVTADDFVMTHSDRWVTGGKPLLVDSKQSFAKRIESRSYLSYELDSVKIELHSNSALVYGRYIASMRNTPPQRMWFSVWFEHLYSKQNGKWMYVSHRTIQGANYGPDKQAVMLPSK